MYVCVYHIFISLSVDGRLSWFYILAVKFCNEHRSCWIRIFISFKYIVRSGSYASFLRNIYTVFHWGCTNLYSHRECTRIPVSPHPHKHLLFVDFLAIAILTGVKWYLTLVYISLISEVECLHVPVDHLCPPWISEIRWNWPSRIHQSTILHHSTILFPTLFWLLDSYPLKNHIIFWWVLLPWMHSVPQLTWLDINLF